MQSLCITRAVERALFHKRRIRQIDTGSEIFSARVHFHFRAPPLRSVATRGKPLRFKMYSEDQPMHFGFMKVNFII